MPSRHACRFYRGKSIKSDQQQREINIKETRKLESLCFGCLEFVCGTDRNVPTDNITIHTLELVAQTAIPYATERQIRRTIVLATGPVTRTHTPPTIAANSTGFAPPTADRLRCRYGIRGS